MSENETRPQEFCDLACECGSIFSLPFKTETEEFVHCTLSRIDINNEESKLISKPAGRYVSLLFGNVRSLDGEARGEIAGLLGRELSDMCQNLVGAKKPRVLVVGLGNREIAFDSVGARTCGRIAPDGKKIFAFETGVSGNSGIDSGKLVKSVVECTRAELVIAVDSLVARSEERVGRVIQLADSGIAPGSGVGHHAAALNRKSLGVPVIAVGIPSALYAGEDLAHGGYLAVSPDVLTIAESASEILAESLRGLLTNF